MPYVNSVANDVEIDIHVVEFAVDLWNGMYEIIAYRHAKENIQPRDQYKIRIFYMNIAGLWILQRFVSARQKLDLE